jgi:hypothetical protein
MHGRRRVEASDVVDGHLRVLLGESHDRPDRLRADSIREIDAVADLEPAHPHVMSRVLSEPRDAPPFEGLRVREETG